MCSTFNCNLMLHKWFRRKQRKNCNDKMDLPKCFEFWFFRMTDDYQFKLYLQTFYAYKENSPPIHYAVHNNTFWNKWFGFALFCQRPIVANPKIFLTNSNLILIKFFNIKRIGLQFIHKWDKVVTKMKKYQGI